MKQVKGVALLNFVKTIRADKSGVYSSYLEADDISIMNRRIQPAVWYPYETFKRCFNAVFEVIAKKNPDSVKEWGRLYCESLTKDFFKITIKQNNPLEYIKRIPVYLQTFYDFGKTDVVIENPNRALLEMIDYDPDFMPFYMFNLGWLQKAAELCGAQNVRCEFVDKSWDTKSNTTSYRITWE